MTLAELRAQVRFNIKRQSAAFSDALIDQRLIWAVERIAQAHTFEEMRKVYYFTLDTTGTLATNMYAFPTRMKDIYTIRIEDGAGTKLEYWHARRFDICFPQPSLQGTGNPSRYVDYGDHFMVHPFAGTAHTGYIRCSVYPTPMVIGTDAGTPGLNNKDKLVASLGTAFCFESLQEPELYGHWSKIAAQEYMIAVEGDQSAEDWIPQARPFNSGMENVHVGLGYNQPHIYR